MSVINSALKANGKATKPKAGSRDLHGSAGDRHYRDTRIAAEFQTLMTTNSAPSNRAE